MSVRYGLLAVLARGPRHGSRLRSEFEALTGAVWPLNIGQVYTTLGRLARDGLVTAEAAEPVGDTTANGAHAAGHRRYRITPAGRAALATWFASPVERGLPARDELAAKLALAAAAPHPDMAALLRTQRRHTLGTRRDLLRRRDELLATAPLTGPDLARLLALEQLILRAEAEASWLDRCATRLLPVTADPTAAPGSATDPPVPG